MTLIKIAGRVTEDALAKFPDPASAIEVVKQNVARMLLAKEAGTDTTGLHQVDPSAPLDPRIIWTVEETRDDGSVELTGALEV